ncbi:hypothetical protein Taro_010851 [Colocasia esculenta]|uniref:Ubiquitin-like protease family profile domain-containing protein n=1 Tax=Colocasia esculenta TaxID=4460 RepID=A0A843UEC2_COLES|nr:hypothetical protein [Colocasia esculenta]
MLGTLGEERLVDVTILDCFWYHMYLNGSPKVMEWIKEKCIFSKTYTFVPIVDGGHWNLLILCNLGNSFNNNYSLCMILLDSLIISEPLKAEPKMRRRCIIHRARWLVIVAFASIPLLVPKVPQQRDGEECGVFTLYYIYLFLKSAPATFSFTSYPYFMTTTWFSYSEIDAFEQKIRKFADLSINDSPVISMPCEELEDEGDSTVKDHDVGMKRKGRGPTMCHDMHALEDGKKICVEWDDIGQPMGKGGKSLRIFLGTVARNADKCPINVQSWDKMPQNCIEDVWLFIQRKYDVPNEDLYRNWVMKDLSFKWKFHKYDLRRKYLKQDKKGVQIQPPSRYHINEDMWREAVKLWTSSTFREKLKALKQTQPSANSSNPVVAKDDAFSKVFGEEKSGRIRGVGTGPTPVTLWGRKNEMLKSENKTLHQRIKVLEEKFAKLENKELEETSLEDLQMGTENGKKVKLLDLENEQVAEGIVMSMDPAKIIMGRPIGTVYCEVSIHYANKPDAPLFVKDDHRFRIKDAIGSHILWFRDYVLVDEAKRTLFSGTKTNDI